MEAALVDAGGWAVVIAMLSAMGAGVIKRWWVPGWIYRRSEDRNERLEAALRDLTQAVKLANDLAVAKPCVRRRPGAPRAP